VAVLEAAGEDADLEDFREAATEDLDCLLLFEPQFDGVGHLGMSNLRFEDVQAVQGDSARPPLPDLTASVRTTTPPP
jgi:hypothetical protein